MGMFGNSGRPVFKPSVYQPGRHNRRLPRGLGLLCIGIVLGAGGVLFLQTNYGPPRLSTEQSEQVRSELNAATLERQRLQDQIDDLQHQLQASRAAQTTAPAAPAETTPTTQPAPATPAATDAQPAATATPEPAPDAAATAPAAAPAAMPAAHTREPSEAADQAPADQTPSETQELAAPEHPRPVEHRAVHHQDYEEPHSELRMTIIPMPAQSK